MRQQPRQAPRRRGAAGPTSPPEVTSPQPAVGFDDEMLELINEYFYGIRIFPGQDPGMVYVGWVTTQYHLHSADFSHDQVRVATVQKLDSYGGVQESVDRLSCYMVRADELYGEVSTI